MPHLHVVPKDRDARWGVVTMRTLEILRLGDGFCLFDESVEETYFNIGRVEGDVRDFIDEISAARWDNLRLFDWERIRL